MQLDELKNRLAASLPDAEIHLDGDGHHFQAYIITDAFIGLSKLARQQLVYQGVNELIKSGELHAFSMRTFTCQEWQDNQA